MKKAGIFQIFGEAVTYLLRVAKSHEFKTSIAKKFHVSATSHKKARILTIFKVIITNICNQYQKPIMYIKNPYKIKFSYLPISHRGKKKVVLIFSTYLRKQLLGFLNF